MKILLINPSQKNVYGTPMPQAYPPLGLLYIGAVLEKEGHDLKLIDMDNEITEEEDFKKAVLEFNPQLVCFTATTPTVNHVKEIAKNLKQILDVPTLVGGIHATIAPEDCLKSEYLDFAVKGEGELTISELVKALKDKKFDGIDGLWYKENGEIKSNKDRELVHDLDSLPFPARHLLKNPNAYVPPDALHKPVASIMTTRGCAGRCTYCCTKQIYGLRLRTRSVKNILAEIEHCIKEYGVKEIHILDDNFVYSKKRVLEFCDEVKRRNYKIYFEFANGLRADNTDKEIFEALRSIGVVNVGFGVESGNQQILDNIKKGIKKERVLRAFKEAKEAGFQTWGFFMFGLPGENEETMQDTIDFAKELNPDFAKFLILKPFPGSEVYNDLQSQNLIFDHNYDHYGPYTAPVHRLPNIDAKTIHKYQQKANREFYLRPSKIWSHVKRIKTKDQLLYNLRAFIFLFRKLFK